MCNMKPKFNLHLASTCQPWKGNTKAEAILTRKYTNRNNKEIEEAV